MAEQSLKPQNPALFPFILILWKPGFGLLKTDVNSVILPLAVNMADHLLL